MEFLKTRNSGGVGSKVSLAFDLETLRVTDLDGDDNDDMKKPKTTSAILDQIKNRNNNESAQEQDTENPSGNKVSEKMEHTNNLRNLINKTKKK